MIKETYSYTEVKELEKILSTKTTHANFLLENLVGLRILGKKLLVAPGTIICKGKFEDVVLYEETIPKGKAILQYDTEIRGVSR